MPARLLVVEDDPSVRRSLAEMLAEEGFVVELRAVLARVLEDRRSRDLARRSVEEDGAA